jgi:spore coat polysaccharide biosynthesis protein SpsF (cytidylyltransferase family)
MTASTLAVIQANATDLLAGDADPRHYVIGPLRRSRRIDRIVIAAPETPQNCAFVDLGRAWGIDLFLGSEYDVIDRLLQAAAYAGAADDAVLVRVLMNRFYLDIGLVDRMIDLLRSTASDFVTLPYDFDINFGADVLTLDCLRRVDRALEGAGRDHERFRPWLFIEDHPDLFRVATCTDVPSYPRSRLDEIQASGLFAERDCMTCSTFTYDLIADAIAPDDVVLDIACGSGEGSGILARRCREVYGCDLSGEVVAEASARGISNARFDVQDGCALTYPDGLFSVVVNSNTLEHVNDDEAMLRSLHRVLRSGGRLILETPLLRSRPFGCPLLPSHLREYDKDALIGLLERCGFTIVRKLGMNRGMYLDWNRAREAVLVEARKTS